MIIWGVSHLVCLMYGVEMIPEARALFFFLSWFELMVESVVLLFFVIDKIGKRKYK